MTGQQDKCADTLSLFGYHRFQDNLNIAIFTGKTDRHSYNRVFVHVIAPDAEFHCCMPRTVMRPSFRISVRHLKDCEIAESTHHTVEQ